MIKNINITKSFKADKTYKIRQISLRYMSDLYSIGSLIASSKGESETYNILDFESPYKLSVKVYKSNLNPLVAYRIYDNLDDPFIEYDTDAEMISKLQKKQESIKLTDFPTGVVTLGGKVIGQEVPFYEGKTLLEHFQNDDVENPEKIYDVVRAIIDELYDNGIAYFDIHPENFMIDKKGNIHLIDFDAQYIKYEQNIMHEVTITENYNILVNRLEIYLQMNHGISLENNKQKKLLF